MQVIHKTVGGVIEEKKCFSTNDVVVLDYVSPYTGQSAIWRVREEKNNYMGNSELFVTEVRIGKSKA